MSCDINHTANKNKISRLIHLNDIIFYNYVDKTHMFNAFHNIHLHLATRHTSFSKADFKKVQSKHKTLVKETLNVFFFFKNIKKCKQVQFEIIILCV